MNPPTLPIIGVHLLTEFVFCSRAGLCTRETFSEDEPVSPANLNFLPDLDENEMRETLRNRRIRALKYSLGSLVAMIVAVVLRANWGGIWPWVAFTVALTCFLGCLHSLLDCVILGFRLWAARRAIPGEPDLAGTEEQPINWWALRRAGYEPIKYTDSLTDMTAGLSGRPWRVLRRGGERIPVFRRDDDGPVKRQHRIRLAAYCHLLETCEGCKAPFGILLNRETRGGIAVLIPSGGAEAIFGDALERARAAIRDAEAGKKPPKPKPVLCRGCPHGKPCRVSLEGDQPFSAGGIPLQLHAVKGLDGHLYHSHCGDRFGETPPHDRAIRLGLPN